MASPPSPTAGNGMPDHVTADSMCVNHRKKAEGGRETQSHDVDSVMRYTPPVAAEAEDYKMNHEKRGRAIIFNHKKYNETLNLQERTGTNADKKLLKEQFEKLRFEVEDYDDLRFADIKKHLTEISQHDHKNEDCIIVAVLTHGKGKGKLYAFDELYKVDTLWSNFTADTCPSLAGKPKIFIIQACRGEEASEGMSFKSSIQIDSNRMEVETTSHRYSIPVEADQLIAFSTYEGRVALRSTKEGSWFIQELCKELEDNGEKIDLLTLFTNVNRRVAVNKEYKNVKQMPIIHSTLTRKIFFGSATVCSQITITTDIGSLLGMTNKKLDHLVKMLEDKNPSTPVLKTKPPSKQGSSSNWECLQSSLQTVAGPMPRSESIYKMAEALKLFLEEEADRLKPTIKEDGEFILNFLSCWGNLNEELRCYGYKKLVIFLNENAREWKVYKLLSIPDSSSFSGQHCHRRWSQSDVTDAVSTSNKTSTIPRRIVPKKYRDK